jgi:DNA-binding MarR family transcriptional regulator
MTKPPFSSRLSRPQLLKALDEACRKVGALSVLISDLVAARVGLNSTDLECLDLLLLSGSTTAGRVASHTGLTTGATTAVIDRLEAAGFVKRRRDGRDRRVVLIDVVQERTALIEPFYSPLVGACAALHARYDTGQLEAFADYLGRAIEASAAHVAWLQTQPALSRARRRRTSQRTAFRPPSEVPSEVLPQPLAPVAPVRGAVFGKASLPGGPGSRAGNTIRSKPSGQRTRRHMTQVGHATNTKGRKTL